MKTIIISFIAMTMLQFVLCDLMADLKQEFDSIDSALEAKSLEKELLSIDLNDDHSAKKDSSKGKSVESQLKDVLDSIGKDKESEKKEAEKDSHFHQILEKFEKSDSAEKEKLVSDIEAMIKKEVMSSDVAEDTSSKCEDIRGDCDSLAKDGKCQTHESTMRKKCAKTCQFCVDCKNKLKDSTCKAFKKYGFCEKHKQRLMNLCFKECDYCTPPGSNPKGCKFSEYGCCWDMVTSKVDKAGTNCMTCSNKYRYLCPNFKAYCEKATSTGEFLRKHCPESCGLCKSTCFDEFKYGNQCPVWKRLGWCRTQKNTMKNFCQKTCEFC